MSTSYLYTALRDSILDSTINPSAAYIVAVRDHINRAARIVYGELDLRGSKRRSTITPFVFDDFYDYTCPVDLKDYAIIDIIPQGERKLNSRPKLVTPEYFDRKKGSHNLLVAVQDDDLARKLRIDIDVEDTVTTVSTLDSLTAGGGTWVLFGDATAVAVDTDYKVKGSASIRYDLVGSGTTAGIQNTDLTDIDISDYVNNGSATVWAYINSTTDLTNFIVRLGSDSSNYYSMTVTTQADGTAFQNGWNLLRFAFSGATTTGTPVTTATDYAVLYQTKTSGKLDDGYRFDDFQLHTGESYDIFYYSAYPWQDTSGTYIENSTANTDYIVATMDEVDIIVMRGKMEVNRELRDWEQYKFAQADYIQLVDRYRRRTRSERLRIEYPYYS